MQEVLGMMSTGMQTGEGAGKYVNFDEALQAGIGGGISGFFLPFAGDIKTQGAMAIRETAANIALRYGGDNKYLTKVKTAIEWFNQSKAELDKIIPVTPPKVNKKIKPIANNIGVRKSIVPPHKVAIQLKILIPVGTAIIIVAAVK